MPLRPELQTVVDACLVRGPASMSLDDLADALAPHGAGYDEVEAAIDVLEEAGVLVDAPASPDLPVDLALVLGTARTLAAELGHTPSVEQIAARAELPESAVRRALRFASAT